MTRCRRGVSMIEAIVAVAMSGIVLVAGVGMIHMVLEVERATRRSTQLSTAAARLSHIFRQDVHQATHVEVPTTEETAAHRVKLRLPSKRTIVYEVRANRLARDESVKGQPHHQDEFVFPAGCQIALQTSRGPDRIAVQVRQPAVDAAGTALSASRRGPTPRGLTVRLEATMARDHRYGRESLVGKTAN